MSINSKYEFTAIPNYERVSQRAFGKYYLKHQSYLYMQISDLINARNPERNPKDGTCLYMGHDEKVEVILDVFLNAVHYLNELEAHPAGSTEESENPNIICTETKLGLCFEIEKVLRYDVLPLIQKIIKENT